MFRFRSLHDEFSIEPVVEADTGPRSDRRRGRVESRSFVSPDEDLPPLPLGRLGGGARRGRRGGFGGDGTRRRAAHTRLTLDRHQVERLGAQGGQQVFVGSAIGSRSFRPVPAITPMTEGFHLGLGHDGQRSSAELRMPARQLVDVSPGASEPPIVDRNRYVDHFHIGEAEYPEPARQREFLGAIPHGRTVPLLKLGTRTLRVRTRHHLYQPRIASARERTVVVDASKTARTVIRNRKRTWLSFANHFCPPESVLSRSRRQYGLSDRPLRALGYGQRRAVGGKEFLDAITSARISGCPPAIASPRVSGNWKLDSQDLDVKPRSSPAVCVDLR